MPPFHKKKTWLLKCWISHTCLLLLSFYSLAQQPELILPVGEDQEYECSILIDNGKLIATGSKSTINIWEAKSGLLLKKIALPNGRASEFTLNADQTMLIVSGGKFITLVDLKQFRILNHIDGSQAAFHGKDNLLITKKDTLSIFDPLSGRFLNSLKAADADISHFKVSAGGDHFMAFSEEDSSLNVWNLNSLLHIVTIKGRASQILIADFDPLGSRILVAYDNDSAYLYSLENKQVLLKLDRGFLEPPEEFISMGGTVSRQVLDHSRLNSSSAFTSDGSYIHLWNTKTINFFNASNGSFIKKIFSSSPPLLSPDLKYIAVKFFPNYSGVGHVSLLSINDSLKTEKLISLSPKPIPAYHFKRMCFSADSRFFLSDDLELISIEKREKISEVLKNKERTGVKSFYISDSLWAISYQNLTEIWNINNGKKVMNIPGTIKEISGNNLITSIDKDSIFLININNLIAGTNPIYIRGQFNTLFSSQQVLVSTFKDTIQFHSITSNVSLASFKGKLNYILKNDRIATQVLYSRNDSVYHALIKTDTIIAVFSVHGIFKTLAPDSNKLVVESDHVYSTWSLKERKKLFSVPVPFSRPIIRNDIEFSNNSKVIIVYKDYGFDEHHYFPVFYNAQNGKEINQGSSGINKDIYSPFETIGKTWYYFGLRSTSWFINGIVSYFDEQGKQSQGMYNREPLQLSTDGLFFTASYKDSIEIWSNLTGKKKFRLPVSSVETTFISPDSKYLFTCKKTQNGIQIWNSATGKLIREVLAPAEGNTFKFSLSKSGNYLYQYSSGSKIFVWELVNDNLIYKQELKGNVISYEGNGILISSRYSSGISLNTLYDDNSLKELFSFKSDVSYGGQSYTIDQVSGILVAIEAPFVSIIDIKKYTCLYKSLSWGDENYLITDNKNHYDGTQAARKKLYFTCNKEIIELEQLKDQLWVPNLAERIMKGDSINAKTLDELNICGLTPAVEDLSTGNTEYRFKILPRRGGLGETALYINGIEVRKYKPEQLHNKGDFYELIVKVEELKSYFIAGQENPVKVKAYTADNTISSRGVIITEDKTKETPIPPNLYAVMVGVSDYKGIELDLKYAAKDATDISSAVGSASRRLLNTDGKEHVFIYNLTTASDRYLLPEKKSIKKILEDIGKKATADDILLVFFSGHGVMQGEGDKNQFYFLTADASQASAVDAKEVGISTAELTEWMKPANIKAQKRILIFDACNSGQAIRDFVQYGKADQGYAVAKNDEKGQQIKAIEKLNNQSGLFILAASASSQSAYEMSRYSQGLLTYSLLKAIKQQPDILENGKYLDVSNWLNAAKKTVSILAGGTGARQEPQLNANNNFNIGLVDEEVRNKIVLADAKPLFTQSSFQNAAIPADNLKLSSAIDKKLELASNENNSSISFSRNYDGEDAYLLSGKYSVQGEDMTVTVLLFKGSFETHRYEIKGKAADKESVTNAITNAAMDWLKKN